MIYIYIIIIITTAFPDSFWLKAGWAALGADSLGLAWGAPFPTTLAAMDGSVDTFLLRPVPANPAIFEELLRHDRFRYRALGLARLVSLVAATSARGDTRDCAALIAASRSTYSSFFLSSQILKVEREFPGAFTRPQ